MAFRKIHDEFWTDPDMEEMTPEQKYFYIYLITNPKVNQIGLYEFSPKRASFETGYSIDTVYELLKYFEDAQKIVRSDRTKEILIVKFYYHNKNNSPKLQRHVEELLRGVKDKSLIQYIYSMDTTSQEEEEKEEEKEEDQEKEKERSSTNKSGDYELNAIRPTPGIPQFDDTELEQLYQRYLAYMKRDKKRIVGIDQEQMQRQMLLESKNPKSVIRNTMTNGWMRLVPSEEPKSKTNANHKTRGDRRAEELRQAQHLDW